MAPAASYLCDAARPRRGRGQGTAWEGIAAPPGTPLPLRVSYEADPAGVLSPGRRGPACPDGLGRIHEEKEVGS